MQYSKFYGTALLFFIFLFSSFTPSLAQGIETKNDYSTGYITGTYQPYFTTIDGVLYATNDYGSGWILMRYPAGSSATVYEVDRRCIRIARGAFEGARNLQFLYIPATVKTIGENAFDGCTSLQGIFYGESPSSAPAVRQNAAQEKQEVARYTTDGRKCTTADKGIQIIVYSDYTTKIEILE